MIMEMKDLMRNLAAEQLTIPVKMVAIKTLCFHLVDRSARKGQE